VWTKDRKFGCSIAPGRVCHRASAADEILDVRSWQLPGRNTDGVEFEPQVSFLSASLWTTVPRMVSRSLQFSKDMRVRRSAAKAAIRVLL